MIIEILIRIKYSDPKLLMEMFPYNHGDCLFANTEVRRSCPPPQSAPAKPKGIEELKTFIRTEREAYQAKKALAVPHRSDWLAPYKSSE